jgi:glycosyltransferase involved in cell wall biosynthesis
MHSAAEDDMEHTVAYILKAFGRTSETFISNEIYLLEQLGLRLRIFSLKRLEGQKQHAKLSAIESPVTYLPETEDLSGASFLGWLYRNLPGYWQAHQRLIASNGGAYFPTLLAALAMCFRYRSRWWSGPKKVFLKEFLQAGYIADTLRCTPDVKHLHAHFCHGVTTVAMFVSRLRGLPFSFTAHAKDIYLPELNPGDLLAVKMRRARFVVTCTEANKIHLDHCRPAGSARVHAIYHGLDTALFAGARKASKPAVPRILSVGRFVEKKGFTFLVDACAVLRDRGIRFECLIVGGSDTYQAQVQKRIAEHALESLVTLRNAVTQEELRHIYSASSIFALPCQVLDNGDRDGIPNVLAEAMAMEMPVVSTDISGIPEIVRSGENGLLVPPRDSEALAGALVTLMQNAPLSERLGRAGRATILEVFDSRRNTARLAELFTRELGIELSSRGAEEEALTC